MWMCSIPGGGAKSKFLSEQRQTMKTCFKKLFLLPTLIASLSLIPAGRVTAQTFTTLYSFTATSFPTYTNSDGASPDATLILSGNTLYGTAGGGGSSGNGTVFKVNTDGTSFTTLYSFTAWSTKHSVISNCRYSQAGLWSA